MEEKGINVERQRISFEAPVKELGTHTAIIDLHKEVKAHIPIKVIAVAKK